MTKYSCIVPVFNEAERILGVLEILTNVPQIDQIICVDDGSSDNSSETIKIHFPKITLIKHPTNKGRTEAIQSGLIAAKSKSVLLMDADLEHLKAEEVSHAFKIYENKTLDCLVLSTASPTKIDTLLRIIFRAMKCMAGCRIINKFNA